MKAIADISGSGSKILLDGRKSEGGVRFTWTIEKMPLGIPLFILNENDLHQKGYLDNAGSLVTIGDLPSPGDYEFKLTIWDEDSNEQDSITIPYSY